MIKLTYLNLPYVTLQTKSPVRQNGETGIRMSRLFLNRGLESSLGGIYSSKSHFQLLLWN